MRAFVRIREMLGAHRELAAKLKDLENRVQDHDEKIQAVFEAIRQLMIPPEKPRKRIYPVQSVSPPSAMMHFQDGVATLEPSRVINFI